jgi:hypothetical protein
VKWLRDNDPTFGTATWCRPVPTRKASRARPAPSPDAAEGYPTQTGRCCPWDSALSPSCYQPELAALPRLPIGRLHSREASQGYSAALPWLDDLVRLWEAYLQYGGFPAAVAAARQAQPIPGWFIDDLFAVLYRDAFAFSRLSESQTSALVARLWAGMGSPVNTSRIGADVDVSHDAVARHIGYLRDSYLLWSCPQAADGAYIRRGRSPRSCTPSTP